MLWILATVTAVSVVGMISLFATNGSHNTNFESLLIAIREMQTKRWDAKLKMKEFELKMLQEPMSKSDR